VLGLGVAPAIQPFHGDHPQDDFDRRGEAAVGEGPRIPSGEVSLDRLEHDVIVQQTLELGEDRVQLPAQLGDQRQQIQRLVAIAPHRRASLDRLPFHATRPRASSPGIEPPAGSKPAKSHRKLTLPPQLSRASPLQ
jgi:hypothetical protein